MIYVKRIICYSFTILFINIILLYDILDINIFLKILLTIFLFAVFIYYNIKPEIDRSSPGRQKILIGGYELIISAGIIFMLQIILYIYVCLIVKLEISTFILILNGVFSIFFDFIIILNGFIRAFTTSKQLGIVLRVLLIIFWWVPIVNTILLGIACKIVKTEYDYLLKKRFLNEARKGKEVCKTKYPILMVHGIFFRDWKYFNYWGRIPKELTDNGANIFYGNHNSSLPVEQSAHELKQRILSIVKETNCEKVNIIAHSKGGIDSRYAISCLGMDSYVASLTTINTPHKGSSVAKMLIEKTPEKILSEVGKKYKTIFTKLGDDDCDFFSSISELTVERCAELNEKMIDRENILYQSAGSQMKSASSAGFPLNAGYITIKSLDGDNDGLVSTDSMKWGNFLGILKSSGNKGISHGDMIDLTRKNISGFDVCEFYVELVSGLKEKGL